MSSPEPDPKDIFAEALKLAGPERVAYLDRVCAGNPALRQEVESLTAAHERAGDFLNHTVSLPETGVGLERPGTVIGRYKLLERIGEGGFGVVYMAEQTEPVQRKVALKIIKAGMDTKEVVARFEAERQALALMDHPNIAKVLDGGVTENARPYFVMELVRGRITITDYCDRHSLSTAERLQLFIRVCHAVQHAHQKGIIHRDLKPGNVLITLHDGEPVPKVIDFGVAKALGQKLTGRTLFTPFAQMLGTPAYMSPEQAELSGLDVDTRCDVYSLGVLLYELLTGVTPFDKETMAQAALDEIRRIIREAEPPKPSTRLQTLGDRLPDIAKHRHTEPAALSRLVRGDLDWIVMKCLEKDRGRRYETADGLAMDVQRFLQNEPIVARPPSALYRFQKLVRRHRLEFAAGGAALTIAVVAAAAFVVIMLDNRARVERQRDAARTAESEELRQRHRAENALGQMENQRASELFATDNSATALAYLARVLRRDPSNSVAADRLLSALTFRNFAFPVADLRNTGQVTSATAFTRDGARVVTAYADGTTRFWDACTGRLISEWPKHGAKVVNLFLTGNGRWLALAAADKTVRIRNLETGLLQGEMIKLDADVRSMHLTEDGLRLLTLSGNTPRLWNVLTGQMQRSLPQYEEVCTAKLAPDGNTVVVISRSDMVTFWNGVTGRPGTPPPRTKRSVTLSHTHAEWSLDSRRVIIPSSDDTGIIWGVNEGDPVTELSGHQRPIFSTCFSPEGTRVATGSCDSSAMVWNATTGQPLFPPLHHDNHVHYVAFSPDATRLVTASLDRTARVWDVRVGHPLTEPLRHNAEVRSAIFSPEGRRLVTCTPSPREVVPLWDIRPGQSVPLLLTYGAPRAFARFSPEGRCILTATSNLLQVWDARTASPTKPLKQVARVDSTQFSPEGQCAATMALDTVTLWDVSDGWQSNRSFHVSSGAKLADLSLGAQRLATISNNVVHVWDARTGALLAACTNNARVGNARFSPTGSRLVTAAMDNTARLWDSASSNALRVWRHADWVLDARFSPNGKQVVTTSKDDTAGLWDAHSGKGPRVLRHKGQVVYAAFSPDSRLLVTCSEDKTARVWEAGTGKPITQPLKHLSRVALAEFSPDARRLVTAAEDGTARVWDARTGTPLTEPLKHDARITSVEFSPDGQQLLTASADGTVRLWEVPPSPVPVPAWLPALAEAVAGERISDEKGVESVPLSRLFKLKQQLLSDSGQGFYLRWAHWFFADRESRTLSPFRAATVPEYVQQRIKGGSTEGLVEALWLSPTNGLVWAGLARKLRDFGFSTNSLLHADAEWLVWAELARKFADSSFTTNSLLRADAEWFSHRAVELSPADPDVWLVCADVLHSLARMPGASDSADLPGLDPDRAPRLEDACQLYSKVIDLPAADAHAKELLPQALLGRSAVLKMLGRTAEAQADLLRAKNVPPSRPATKLEAD